MDIPFLKLDKEHIIASPTYNRWLVPPAALAIHLSIGMAYGFSVFWLPLQQSTGWSLSSIVLTFTLFIVFLGLSAATFGPWLERVGPRKAGFVATICWSGSFLLSALAIYTQQLWLLWLSSGVIGGIGLGLGYISPVSTLLKWFPDKRGMATGMAIMGFGGGALIGSPLANYLMNVFSTENRGGVWQTFIVLGIVYFILMMIGVFLYRVPPATYMKADESFSDFYVHVKDAHKTRQFWLLWAVLCLNVSAGIGILALASPMIQEIFGGRLIGVDKAFAALSNEELSTIASIAATFVSVLSIFNIIGRIVWSSFSDYIGRKMTYMVFFGLGAALYFMITITEQYNSVILFALCVSLIISMYGGGFATIPAYLSDIFGTKFVGAIHGRILTAWSAAGVIGPLLISELREYYLDQGLPVNEAYMNIMYILAGLLVVGFICNYFVTPVSEEWKNPTEINQNEQIIEDAQ